MADKMVYVVDVMPAIKGSARVEVITVAQLADELAAGWEIVTQVDGKPIPWDPPPKKPALGERTVLRRREDNRGVSVVGREAPARMVTLRDDYGRTRSVTADEAMGESLRQLALSIQQQSKGAGHLGAPGQHDIPGVTVISAEITAKAFDVGLQAGIAGAPKDTNPFPPGTDAHTIWLNGYAEAAQHASQKPGQGECERAYSEGLRTAKRYGPDDEVTCPYRGLLRAEWERGYRDGGGTFIPLGK